MHPRYSMSRDRTLRNGTLCIRLSRLPRRCVAGSSPECHHHGRAIGTGSGDHADHGMSLVGRMGIHRAGQASMMRQGRRMVGSRGRGRQQVRGDVRGEHRTRRGGRVVGMGIRRRYGLGVPHLAVVETQDHDVVPQLLGVDGHVQRPQDERPCVDPTAGLGGIAGQVLSQHGVVQEMVVHIRHMACVRCQVNEVQAKPLRHPHTKQKKTINTCHR